MHREKSEFGQERNLRTFFSVLYTIGQLSEIDKTSRLAHQRLKKGDCYEQFVAKGLERNEDLLRLNPDSGLQRLASDTGGFLITDSELPDSDASGRSQFVSGLPVEKIPPGNYELKITISSDALSLSRSRSFTIVD